MSNIANTAKIFKNVILGNNIIIEDFAVIGIPPVRKSENELKTIIGDNALIRSHSIIYAGNKIGNNFATGQNVSIRENNVIGNDLIIALLPISSLSSPSFLFKGGLPRITNGLILQLLPR